MIEKSTRKLEGKLHILWVKGMLMTIICCYLIYVGEWTLKEKVGYTFLNFPLYKWAAIIGGIIFSGMFFDLLKALWDKWMKESEGGVLDYKLKIAIYHLGVFKIYFLFQLALGLMFFPELEFYYFKGMQLWFPAFFVTSLCIALLYFKRFRAE